MKNERNFIFFSIRNILNLIIESLWLLAQYFCATWSSFNRSKRVTQTTADLNPALCVKAVNAVDSISIFVTPASFKRSIYRSLSLELYSQNAPSNLACPEIFNELPYLHLGVIIEYSKTLSGRTIEYHLFLPS